MYFRSSIIKYRSMNSDSRTTPNIFTHATSELSQDAFLAYLIEWADPGHDEDQTGMHRAGKVFLTHLLRQLPKEEVPSKTDINAMLERVSVACQKSSIDVLVNLHYKNGEHLTLVIEDKVHAGDYNDLEGYVKRSGKMEGCSKDVRGLFIKTGEQFSYEIVENAAYGTFLRANFIRYFEELDEQGLLVSDTIFSQWRAQFYARQEKLMGWRNSPVADWENEQFIGFYQHLTANWKDEEGRSLVQEWRWVNPRNGDGFYGLWSRFLVLPGETWRAAFVQVQRNELVIRAGIDSEVSTERAAYRNHVYDTLLEHKLIGTDGTLGMERPDRWGNGKSMEICRLAYPEGWGSAEMEVAVRERYGVLVDLL
jgi:hypothetical protein